MESLTPLISRDDETVEDIVDRIKNRQHSENTDVHYKSETPAVIVEENDAYNARRAERHIVACNVPPKYLHASFSNFTGNDKLIEVCKAYVSGNDSVFLSGKTGCGKTHLAIAMLREFLERRIVENPMLRNESGEITGEPCSRAGTFISVPKLLMEIRTTFNGKAKSNVFSLFEQPCETEMDVINKYLNAGILVLDDLGAEKITDFTASTLNIIIDERINYLKKTVITSNLSLQEIEAQIDARVASRLSAMKNIRINMPDYRKKREKGR